MGVGGLTAAERSGVEKLEGLLKSPLGILRKLIERLSRVLYVPLPNCD